jgi:hypothetical protein
LRIASAEDHTGVVNKFKSSGLIQQRWILLGKIKRSFTSGSRRRRLGDKP